METEPAFNNFFVRPPLWFMMLLTVITPILAGALQHYLYLPKLAAPFLVPLLWLPFIIVHAVQRQKSIDREKQDLQAKYDAEDMALFGHKITQL